MKRKLLPFVAIAMLFAACSSDEPNPPPEAENIPQVANPYRVSLDDALDNAETLLSQISEAETRSGRRVASVKYFTTPSTRSADSDTMLYLVNYENDGGFALLSADSRLRPVYAISDEGSLNMEDTVYNKGLAMFARAVEAEIASLPLNPILPPVDPIVPQTDTIINQYVAPLLSPFQQNWDQRSPYNIYCPVINGVTAPVGCTAVAVGQIMAYHEWPESYGEYTFDWDTINSGNDYNSLARFLRLLGNPENLNMTYKQTSSGAVLIENAQRTFINMGYEDPGEMQNFSALYVTTRLSSSDNRGPVLCRGRDTSAGGHAWVIDGYLQYKYSTDSMTYYGDYLYHCVWGWGGKCNGYFYWEDGFSGNPIEYDGNDPQTGNFIYNYNENLKCLGWFKLNN